MTRVGLYDDARFRDHDAGPGHPERPERLDALRRGLRDANLEPHLQLLGPRPATLDELLRVHTEGHVARVAESQGRTLRYDPDTEAGPRTYEAALLAAGSAVDAVERVLGGELERAFCAVRPPGHHATADRAMGFCYFNNVAVAAAHALERGLERVLVVDFDVHHGNGTQDIFYADPRVLYVSSHAFPFYPGTGAVDEVGTGPGRGYTVNLPLPDGTGDEDFAFLYREVVAPIATRFEPELVLVSAGFDAHRGDPLAGMDLTARGYAALAQICVDIAVASAGGRLVMALEGGYRLDAIASAGAAVVDVMLGRPGGLESPPSPSPATTRLAPFFRETFRPFWPGL